MSIRVHSWTTFNLRKSAFICGSLLFLAATALADSPTKTFTFKENQTPKPYFNIPLPEGNYTLTLTLGSDAADSVTTVKAENHRLMLENIKVPKGQSVTRTITVNVRRPDLPTGGHVSLNKRELDPTNRTWDDDLTLEFDGQNPAVRSIEIKRAPADTPVIYIAGDSTVTDQAKEPYNSWGQMLTRFLNPGIAVANHAESGRALRSFQHEHRLDKILSTIKKGDYLLIQFGHNDQKEKGPGVGAFTTYADSLKHYIAAARDKGATPILITPVARESFDTTGHSQNTLGDYPQAVRRVAKEQNTPLIDLNADTTKFYDALGPAHAQQAFATPKEHTHHNRYGSYEIAKMVATHLRHLNLPLSSYVTEDLKDFDPTHPDPIQDFQVPPSPQESNVQKPEGN